MGVVCHSTRVEPLAGPDSIVVGIQHKSIPESLANGTDSAPVSEDSSATPRRADILANDAKVPRQTRCCLSSGGACGSIRHRTVMISMSQPRWLLASRNERK